MSNITENLEIEEIAWESKFYKIPPKKITAENLIVGPDSYRRAVKFYEF